MTGARHFAVERDRKRSEERRRTSATLLCASCAPAGVESLTLGLLEPRACDGCGVDVQPSSEYVFLRGALDAGEAHTLAVGGSNPSPATKGDGAVYTGDAASLSRDRRPWYDYGKDTGRRLRVKGLVDADSLPVVRPEPMPNAVDPREVDEIHRQSREAMAEGDDRKLGKIYEDLLDTLHSESIPTTDEDPIEKVRLDLRAKELELALGAELAELGRGKGWAVGYQLDERHGQVVLLVAARDKASGLDWLVEVDQRALYAASRRAGADMRMAAREIAVGVRDHVDKARAGVVVS